MSRCGLITALVLTYTWLVVPQLGARRELALAWTAVVLLLALQHTRRSGRWGLQPRALLPALGWTASFTLPAQALILLLGVWTSQGNLPGRQEPVQDFLYLFFWALGQQFVLQTVFLEEASARFGERGPLVAASLFALLHLPNPFLTGVTFLGGLAWCLVYRRYPHLLPPTLSHATTSLLILWSLDRNITGGMRVGYSYLLLQ